MNGFYGRITSSLEKCFPEQMPGDFPALTEMTVLRGQHASFQLIFRGRGETPHGKFSLLTEGDLAGVTEVYRVRYVPVTVPYTDHEGDGYLKGAAPGLYPDVLEPLHYKNAVIAHREQSDALWFTVSVPENFPAGEHTLTLRILDGENEAAVFSLVLSVLPARLPAHGLILTQWFHADALADWYHVPVFSERHWEIIGAFMKTAVEYGQTMILTPLFTPPLDTLVGAERPTVQLVDVEVTAAGYTFGFSRFDRWIMLAQACGFTHFEMSHLFTQWGAKHAPKIIARVNGEEKRIFGWDTDALDPAYIGFLREFLPALTAHLCDLGIEKQCKFHLSDEPTEDFIDQYRAVKDAIADLLSGYDIMDALSNVAFYKEGICPFPIPASDRIESFLAEHIPGLWTYYCCSQAQRVSNRFIGMPSARTRALGMQLFRYDIAGFLHWGYNFYYNQFSCDLINPYLENSADSRFPAGDPFVVYPAPDGTPLPSLRLMVFREALEDLAAMKFASSLVGKDRLIAAVEAVTGEIRFDRCPSKAGEMLAARAAADQLIAENL